MKDNYILTAESVTEGHPDKLCDTIADAVVDACLKHDPSARVACEVMATAGKITAAGEITAVKLPDIPSIICKTVQRAGYGGSDYKDSWETIPGNSDTLLYLGGNEASTHKYISEALGKSTIDTKTHGQTKGRSGSYSTNFQISGRELLTPDEVRMLDNRYCILFIRGTRPVMDEKYELMEHPAIRYTMDGGGPPYIHHGTVEPPIPGKPLFQIDFDNEKENAAA